MGVCTLIQKLTDCTMWICTVDYILTKLLTTVSQCLVISRANEVVITVFGIDFKTQSVNLINVSALYDYVVI